MGLAIKLKHTKWFGDVEEQKEGDGRREELNVYMIGT
jgi:hypothetical protein